MLGQNPIDRDAGEPTPERRQIDPIALETNQPDPALQLTTGRLGGGALSLVVLGIILVIAVVLYGVNGPATNNAAKPTAPATTSATGGDAGGATPTAPQSGPRAE